MSAISIIHAPGDARISDQIADALVRDGHSVKRHSGDPLSGDLGLDDSLAIVVWTKAAASLARIHEQAREALARGALIPVAIDAAAPLGFEDLPPVDLSGWSGELEDPRWRFVLGEISVADRRNVLEDGAVWAGPADREPQQETGVPPSAIISDADWPPENDNYELEAGFDEDDAVEPEPVHLVPQPAAGFRPIHVAIGASLGLVLLTTAAAVLAPIFLSSPERLARAAPSTPDNATTAAAVDEEPPATLAFVTPLEIDGEGDAIPIPDGAKEGENSISVVIDLPVEEHSIETIKDVAPMTPDGGAMDALVAAITTETAPDGAPAAVIDPITEEKIELTALDDYFKDCDLCPVMAVLPAGRFSMGSPTGEPARHVSEGPAIDTTISQPFALGASEVTFAQWQACVDEGGCQGYAPYDHGWGRTDRPVIGVSFEDAQSYASWLSEKTGLAYRLPTEAEWEYAARAGSTTPFSFGYIVSSDQANFNGEHPYGAPVGVNLARTTPAASFAPNSFGLFDMHGNVWEWTADCWTDSHGAAGGSDCLTRVLKGGAWNTGGWRLRSAHRIGKNQAAREYDNGFRLARDID